MASLEQDRTAAAPRGISERNCAWDTDRRELAMIRVGGDETALEITDGGAGTQKRQGTVGVRRMVK